MKLQEIVIEAYKNDRRGPGRKVTPDSIVSTVWRTLDTYDISGWSFKGRQLRDKMSAKALDKFCNYDRSEVKPGYKESDLDEYVEKLMKDEGYDKESK